MEKKWSWREDRRMIGGWWLGRCVCWGQWGEVQAGCLSTPTFTTLGSSASRLPLAQQQGCKRILSPVRRKSGRWGICITAAAAVGAAPRQTRHGATSSALKWSVISETQQQRKGALAQPPAPGINSTEIHMTLWRGAVSVRELVLQESPLPVWVMSNRNKTKTPAKSLQSGNIYKVLNSLPPSSILSWRAIVSPCYQSVKDRVSNGKRHVFFVSFFWENPPTVTHAINLTHLKAAVPTDGWDN